MLFKRQNARQGFFYKDTVIVAERELRTAVADHDAAGHKQWRGLKMRIATERAAVIVMGWLDVFACKSLFDA